MAKASATCFESAKFDCRVASERMYTRSFFIEFIRILSPSNAPPVLRLEGSTETTAICLSLKSTRNLRTSSSTKDDFPAPPVPVIPNIGVLILLASFLKDSIMSLCLSEKFSAAEIILAKPGTFFSFRSFML